MKTASKFIFQDGTTFTVPAGVTNLFAQPYYATDTRVWSTTPQGWTTHALCQFKANQGTSYHYAILAWGYASNGEIGDNSNSVTRSSPVLIAGALTVGNTLGDVTKVLAEGNTRLLHPSGQTAYSWGSASLANNQDGTTITRSSPVLMQGLPSPLRNMWSNGPNTFVLDSSGALSAFGQNLSGTLGINSTTATSIRTQVAGAQNYRDVFAMQNTTYAIKTDESVWAWGSNSVGQFGNGSTISASSPIQTFPANSNWKSFESKANYVAGLKNDGSVYVMGQNHFGSNKTTPSLVSLPSAVKEIRSGGISSPTFYALTVDGSLYGWGSNSSNQIDTSSTATYSSPVLIAQNPNIVGVQAYDGGVFYLLNDGTLWGKGLNTNGQLGIGNANNQPTFQQVLNQVVLGGVQTTVRFIQNYPNPVQMIPIKVTPGSTLTLTPSTGLVRTPSEYVYLPGTGMVCQGIKLMWFE